MPGRYVHTLFCLFSIVVPFDASLTVFPWLHNLQNKEAAPSGKSTERGQGNVQAGKPAPLPDGQR